MHQRIFLLLLYFFTYSNHSKVDSFTLCRIKTFKSGLSNKIDINRRSLVMKNGSNDDDIVLLPMPMMPMPNTVKRSESNPNTNRRNFLHKNVLYLSTLEYILSTSPKKVNAFESSDDNNDNLRNSNDNFNCLLDLPPIEEGYVRVYMCRHGQTEYNRLRLVQGSRIDPPLNDTGMEMGKRIGLALSKLPSADLPTITLHSELKRAQETATIASENLTRARSIIATKKESLEENEKTIVLKTPLIKIKDLNEVDFGDLEGMAVVETRAMMTKTFAAWSIGALDQKFMNNGESGLQILQRIKNTLRLLSDYGNQNKKNIHNPKSILAVSHSTFLKALLCVCLDKSLAEVATINLKNGCINVIDINLNEEEVFVPSTIRNSPFVQRVFSENEGNVDKNMFTFPKVKVIRIDENRHLFGLS